MNDPRTTVAARAAGGAAAAKTLANNTAIFEWIEGWYNPTRRHTSINDRSPAEFETLHHLTATAA